MGVAVKGAPPSNFRALIDFGVISNLTLDYNHMTGNFHQGREVIDLHIHKPKVTYSVKNPSNVEAFAIFVSYVSSRVLEW